MKIGLLSDIHGDAVALELAWAHLTVMRADRIVCAGDLVGYGPHPDRVVAFVAERGIDCVRGNHDRWALQRPPGTPDPFKGGTPSLDSLAVLKTLPPERLVADGPKIGVITHGEPGDDMTFVTRKTHPPALLRRLLREMQAQLLVVGHTHRPMWFRCEEGLVINPGSVVSAPVVSTSRTFALLDWDAQVVTFHDVESGESIVVVPWEEATD